MRDLFDLPNDAAALFDEHRTAIEHHGDDAVADHLITKHATLLGTLKGPTTMTYPDERNDPRDPRNDRGRRDDRRDPPPRDARDPHREAQDRYDRDQRRIDDERRARDRNGGAAPPSKNPDGNDLLPEGDYRVKCVKHQWGFTNANDREQIGVRLKIVEGQFAGRFLTWYGFFTDKTEEQTVKAMRALGFKGDDIRDCSSMYDGEAIAVVQHENNQDSKRIARVRWINGADVAMKNVMSKRDLDGFAARMRGAFARAPGGSTSTRDERPRDSRPPPRDDRDRRPPPDGDDIPFATSDMACDPDPIASVLRYGP